MKHRDSCSRRVSRLWLLDVIERTPLGINPKFIALGETCATRLGNYCHPSMTVALHFGG